MSTKLLCCTLFFFLLVPVAHAETPPPEVNTELTVAPDPLPPLTEEAGWVSLFDGQTLAGWAAADMSYWSVEDGAITAKSTTEKLATRNHYLVWKGAPGTDNRLGDFELKLRHRILTEKDVNGGFQFRSEMFDGDIPDDCRGYQVDNNTNTSWLARLYDEFGRHTLAWRGEHSTFLPGGEHRITPIAGHGEPARFSLGDWHEYHLICKGPEITLKINGRVIAQVTDQDPANFDAAGILALQLHSGPEMVVQFKDLRLKR
jgi:hypothetical protein